MAVKIITKTAGEVKGYSLKVWFLKNIETFKLLGAAITGITTYYAALVPEPWGVFIASVTTIGGKLALDALHFWLSEVEVEVVK